MTLCCHWRMRRGVSFASVAWWVLLWTARSAIGVSGSRNVVPDFDDNLYAQLLMRAVTGTIYPAPTRAGQFVSEDFPTQPYDDEKRKRGHDFPVLGHTMVGWLRLRNVYDAIQTCEQEGVRGDYLEAGVWRGGASIFAAGVLRQLGCLGDRSVWVCDSFQGFEPQPWDGDTDWVKLNPIVAVSEEEVRANFDRYGLGAYLDSSIYFVKGFFADSLPDLRENVTAIAMLRLDGDLFSSTSDILYNLYAHVSIGGFVIVDDYGIEACERAISDFRAYHDVTEPLIQIDNHSNAVYWRKERQVAVLLKTRMRGSGVLLRASAQCHTNTCPRPSNDDP